MPTRKRTPKKPEAPARLVRVAPEDVKAVTIGIRLSAREFERFKLHSGVYAPATFARAVILREIAKDPPQG